MNCTPKVRNKTFGVQFATAFDVHLLVFSFKLPRPAGTPSYPRVRVLNKDGQARPVKVFYCIKVSSSQARTSCRACI